MKVSVQLIRTKPGAPVPSGCRAANGSAGHSMALLLKMHDAVTTLGRSPGDMLAFADLVQSVFDFGYLQGHKPQDIQLAVAEHQSFSGTFQSGVVRIDGKDD